MKMPIRTLLAVLSLTVLLQPAPLAEDIAPVFREAAIAQPAHSAPEAEPFSCEVYVESDTPLYDGSEPSQAKVFGTIPKGSVITAYGMENGMAIVEHSSLSGYAPISSLINADAPAPYSNEAERFYLLVDKSAYTLTVYFADENGERTGAVARVIPIAIGKRSTPTPVGVFRLGEKERWHDFSQSSAPFSIAYTNGRYLHGPLYDERNEDSLIGDSLTDIGKMRTGGCLRMAYSDAAWIYFHCAANQTTLEIVNKVE